MTSKEMGRLSRLAQIKKYGGIKGFKKEMKHRSDLALASRWGKKNGVRKNETS